uniref:DUF7651 domain-containing protein n=1 Tax=Vitis vinifera TaxID=29760 RepID=F6HCX2_VITVI
MCHQNSCVHFSAEEAVAAEESLLIYCKPVELYNILQCRALQNPSFLQRCLRYKIQARRKQRLQMTISLSGTIKDGMQAKDLLPVYILMAKPVSDTEVAAGKQHSEVYRLNRACKLSSFTEFEGWRRAEANFILPEMNKLSLDVKAGKLTILLVSCGTILSISHQVSWRLDISSTSAWEKKMVSLMSCRCDILNIVPLNLKALNKTRILSPLNDPIHDINKNSKEKMKDDHFA